MSNPFPVASELERIFELGSLLGAGIGAGIYSVGEDLVFGTIRTGEGLMLGGIDRAIEIHLENERFLTMLHDIVAHGISEGGPIFDIIDQVIQEYYH
ncbi:MAG: hypothetical protein GY801_52925 [bacterium]|nr:hypothetical protein [bacterium]